MNETIYNIGKLCIELEDRNFDLDPIRKKLEKIENFLSGASYNLSHIEYVESHGLIIYDTRDFEYIKYASNVSFNKDMTADTRKKIIEYFENNRPNLFEVCDFVLKDLYLNDSDIENICKPSLLKLQKIDLSNNQQITIESLKHLLKTPTIGALREQYSCLSSTSKQTRVSIIDVDCRDTPIKEEDIIEASKNPLGNYPFTIYRMDWGPFRVNKKLVISTQDALKFLRVKVGEKNDYKIINMGDNLPPR